MRAVQCKYYDGTACSPSVIGKAVRPILQHYAENKDAKFSYKLYMHYRFGEDSISLPLTVEWSILSRYFLPIQRLNRSTYSTRSLAYLMLNWGNS